MGQDSDEERIRRKAHALWEAEGQPHGRDQDHWDQAREIIAIEDSQGSTLLPRNTGAEEPVEDRRAATNYGDVPNLTDQGESMLTDTSREPSFAPTPKTKSRKPAKDAGPPDAVKAAKPPKVIDKTAQTASIVAGSKASSRKPTSTGKVN